MECDKNAILLGLVLGDGSLLGSRKFSIIHSIKQKEYCEFKAKLLANTIKCNPINVRLGKNSYNVKVENNIEKRIADVVRFNKNSEDFIDIYNLLYINGKKYISDSVLNSLNEIAIALWWLDDGNIDIHKSGNGWYCASLRWSTFCSEKEANDIVNYFQQKWNVVWKAKVSDKRSPNMYNLFCGKKEGMKFLQIIRDFVNNNIPSMSYKVIDLDKECYKRNHPNE